MAFLELQGLAKRYGDFTAVADTFNSAAYNYTSFSGSAWMVKGANQGGLGNFVASPSGGGLVLAYDPVNGSSPKGRVFFIINVTDGFGSYFNLEYANAVGGNTTITVLDSTLSELEALDGAALQAQLNRLPALPTVRLRLAAAAGPAAGPCGDPQLAAGGDVDAVDQTCHVIDDGRHRVGLHRVVELDACRQRRPQLGHAAGQELPVVGVEGGLADPVDQALEGDAADQQFTAGARELVHGRVDGFFAGVHVHCATLWVCSNSVDRVLRSILPLGLRGSGPSRSSMTLGTM